MQQQTQHTLKTVVQENSHSADVLSEQLVQLKVIQGAVARLLERIDEITYKGWDKDFGMAHLSIHEIKDTVRLINMGFHPLFKKISEEVNTLNIHAQELNETVNESESEQSVDAVSKLDINSKEGWNAVAMEGNIKTFTKEFGREPESFEEVLTYITETVVRVIGDKQEKKPLLEQ